MELRLLGPMALLRDGQPVPLPASRKTRALLAALIRVSIEVRSMLRKRNSFPKTDSKGANRVSRCHAAPLLC